MAEGVIDDIAEHALYGVFTEFYRPFAVFIGLEFYPLALAPVVIDHRFQKAGKQGFRDSSASWPQAEFI